MCGPGATEPEVASLVVTHVPALGHLNEGGELRQLDRQACFFRLPVVGGKSVCRSTCVLRAASWLPVPISSARPECKPFTCRRAASHLG